MENGHLSQLEQGVGGAKKSFRKKKERKRDA